MKNIKFKAFLLILIGLANSQIKCMNSNILQKYDVVKNTKKFALPISIFLAKILLDTLYYHPSVKVTTKHSFYTIINLIKDPLVAYFLCKLIGKYSYDLHVQLSLILIYLNYPFLFTKLIKSDQRTIVKFLSYLLSTARAGGMLGETPLKTAFINNKVEICKDLINNFTTDLHDLPYLYYSIKMKNLDLVKLLVSKGVNVNYRFEKTMRPMNYALIHGTPGIVNYLRENGATEVEQNLGWLKRSDYLAVILFSAFFISLYTVK